MPESEKLVHDPMSVDKTDDAPNQHYLVDGVGDKIGNDGIKVGKGSKTLLTLCDVICARMAKVDWAPKKPLKFRHGGWPRTDIPACCWTRRHIDSARCGSGSGSRNHSMTRVGKL